jgi:hypothetical protein
MPRSADSMASPGMLLGLAVLLANDFLLKQAFGNTLTGKLSDFAGLFVFPLFWGILFPRARLAIHIVTAAAFLVWKLEVSEPLLALWNERVPLPLGRTVDATDLVALLAVPAAYLYGRPQPQPRLGSRFGGVHRIRWVVVPVALFAFAATSYRTEYPYRETYLFPVPSSLLVAAVDSLGMTRFPRAGMVSDSVEIWIPSTFCFDHIDAVLHLRTGTERTEIAIAQLAHRCPRSRGDSVQLLRIFEHCFVARVDSVLGLPPRMLSTETPWRRGRAEGATQQPCG